MVFYFEFVPFAENLEKIEEKSVYNHWKVDFQLPKCNVSYIDYWSAHGLF